MFESYRPHNTYTTSASLQNLHYSPHRQQRHSPPKPPPSYSSHLSQSQSFPSELDTVLRHPTNSRLSHRENEMERQSFHQSMAHKMTKVPSSKFICKSRSMYSSLFISRGKLFITQWKIFATTECKCFHWSCDEM